uniref:Uncharacterized protein n=1 Tax=Rhizophora mucronata TaxID=61149 RepID=A0A2P2PDN8_RHIMU
MLLSQFILFFYLANLCPYILHYDIFVDYCLLSMSSS